MSLLRFHCDKITKPTVELGGPEARHISLVRRLTRDDKVELFDGRGALAIATITAVDKHKVSLQVDDLQVAESPDRPQIVIAVSVPKSDRFNWLLSKCTELGVDRISPVIFERTIKQAKNPEIVDRWEKLSISAAKQCRRLFLPQIDAPLLLKDVLQRLRNEHKTAQFLLGSLSEEGVLASRVALDDRDVATVIGPEGGLTDDEEVLLQREGCRAVRLTDTVLRVETAAVGFAAILAAKRLEEMEKA